MESSVVPSSKFKARSGFVIPAVLLVALFGVLFGLGRLMMYRYQCQLRIDRQCEIEKEDVVRSMLNWLRTNSRLDVVKEINELTFKTPSGRKVNVISSPAKVLFPEPYDESSLSNHFSIVKYGQLCGYENLDVVKDDVAIGGTDVVFYKLVGGNHVVEDGRGNKNDLNSRKFGLSVFCENGIEPLLRKETKGGKFDKISFVATNKGSRAALSIELSKIGGWWNDEYGRRYEVNFERLGANARQRMYLMRKNTPWPLTGNGVALCLEFIPGVTQEGNGMQAFYYWGNKEPEKVTNFKSGSSVTRGKAFDSKALFLRSSGVAIGMQLAGQHLSVFSVDQDYVYSENIGDIRDDVYNAFRGGINSSMDNDCDLKMVVEVETFRDDVAEDTVISKIEVAPAYIYDIYIEYPIPNPQRSFRVLGENLKRATVAQPYKPDRENANPIVITYDTHGTDNKGWRKDEREAEKKRNGW